MRRKYWHEIILCGLMASGVTIMARAESTNLEVRVAPDCMARVFLPVASGTAKLEAGDGVLALVGRWETAQVTLKAQRALTSAYVYNYAVKNNWGAPTSKREATTPESRLLEVTLLVGLPKGAKAVDTTDLVFRVSDNSEAAILGFDTVRSAEVSDDYVVRDNGLCITEETGGLPAQYLGILNAKASPSAIVYLSGEATRPLPVRILISIPANAKTVTLGLKKK